MPDDRIDKAIEHSTPTGWVITFTHDGKKPPVMNVPTGMPVEFAIAQVLGMCAAVLMNQKKDAPPRIVIAGALPKMNGGVG